MSGRPGDPPERAGRRGTLPLVLGLIAGLVAAILMFPRTQSTGTWLLKLDDGALIGGLLALGVAIALVVTLLRGPRGRSSGGRAEISVVLGIASIVAVAIVVVRASTGEHADPAVLVGGAAYVIAVLLHGVAAVVGFRAARAAGA
jgi:hypothetical protein